MVKKIIIILAVAILCIFIDQYIKDLFVNGFRKDFGCISFILTYNKGVAFSIFASLGEYVKYMQMFAIVCVMAYLVYDKEFFNRNFIAFGFIFGGGISNIIDRFYHIGVVDYIYYHCGFDFAVFNLADMLINFGVFLIFLFFLIDYKKQKKTI